MTQETTELEALLTELMGPPTIEERPWSWCHWDGERHHFALEDDAEGMIDVTTPAEAISAINARLEQLAPAGWVLSLNEGLRHMYLEARHEAKGLHGWRSASIRGDLGATIQRTLAQMQKPRPPNNPESTAGKDAVVNEVVKVWQAFGAFPGSSVEAVIAIAGLIAAARAESAAEVARLTAEVKATWSKVKIVQEADVLTKENERLRRQLSESVNERAACAVRYRDALSQLDAARENFEDASEELASLRSRPVDAPARKAVAAVPFGDWVVLAFDDGSLGWTTVSPQPEPVVSKSETTEEAR